MDSTNNNGNKIQSSISLNEKIDKRESDKLCKVLDTIKSSVILSNLDMGGASMNDLSILIITEIKSIYIRHPVTNKHATITTVQDGMNFLMTHT